MSVSGCVYMGGRYVYMKTCMHFHTRTFYNFLWIILIL